MDEYGYDLESQVPLGRVVFRVRNRGEIEHELVMVVVPEDVKISINEQLRSKTRRALPTLAFIPRKVPGSTGTFAVDLSPGRFAFICFVVDRDGQNHARKGMSTEFRPR